MEESSRASSESLDRSDKPFLNNIESLDRYVNHRQASRLLPWAVIIPWVLCFALLVGIVIQATATAHDLMGGHPTGYWSAHELGKFQT
jgi:hypothetical protein